MKPLFTILLVSLVCFQSYAKDYSPKSPNQQKCEYGTCKRMLSNYPDGRNGKQCGRCLQKVGNKIICTGPRCLGNG